MPLSGGSGRREKIIQHISVLHCNGDSSSWPRQGVTSGMGKIIFFLSSHCPTNVGPSVYLAQPDNLRGYNADIYNL